MQLLFNRKESENQIKPSMNWLRLLINQEYEWIKSPENKIKFCKWPSWIHPAAPIVSQGNPEERKCFAGELPMLITQLIITQIIIIIVMAHHHGSIPTCTMTHHFFFLSCDQQPPPHITQVTTKHAKTHNLLASSYSQACLPASTFTPQECPQSRMTQVHQGPILLQGKWIAQ